MESATLLSPFSNSTYQILININLDKYQEAKYNGVGRLQGTGECEQEKVMKKKKRERMCVQGYGSQRIKTLAENVSKETKE